MNGARERADAQRLELAREFAALAGVAGVQRWMRWHGWSLLVGCDVCGDRGTAAACWGRMGCHGWENGCGCIGCAVRQARELELLDDEVSPHAHHQAREDVVHHAHGAGGDSR